MKPVKILQVLPALNFCGGIENYVMNYYRHIDRSKVQFDFITHTTLEASYEPEINKLGGTVYKLPVFTIFNFKEIMVQIDNLLATRGAEYKAIHCHMANAAVFYFIKAKRFGIKTRILHSHQPSSADLLSHKIRNYPLLILGNHLATHRIACTQLAGNFLFRKKPFQIVRNAIDVQKFRYIPAVRQSVRDEFHWNDKLIIGHIGRFCAQKNQVYLLKIFAALHEMKENTHLVLIGSGEDETAVRQQAHGLGLDNCVDFLGTREDVWNFYQAFDCFVLPSLYEGLGIVLIEAQCAGLKVFCSRDNIPQDVKITDNLTFISLRESPSEWVRNIIAIMAENTTRTSQTEKIVQAGYSIEEEAQFLEEYYHSVI